MMKCFLPCFGASKRRKHLRYANATLTRGRGQTHVAEGALELQQKTAVEELIDCIAESKIKNEEQSNKSAEVISTKELIKNFEGIKEEEEEETLEIIYEKKDNHGKDDENSESLFSLCIDSGKQVSVAQKDDEIEVNSSMQLDGALCTRKEVSEAFGLTTSVPHVSSVLNPLENLSEKEDTKPLEEQTSCIAIRKVNPNEEDSSAKEPIKKMMDENEEARPSNHSSVPEYRYRDCTDEGYDGINLDDSDFDVTFEEGDDPSPHNKKIMEGEEGADDYQKWVQEESSESLFSLSSYSRKRISSAEKEKEENEVNSLMSAHVTEQEETQGRIPDVSSVLNPIENHTQGRVVKATVQQPLKKEKENINLMVLDDDDILICPEPSLKLSNRKGRHKFNNKKEETVVDTSLSSWLVEPENTPISMNSSSTNSVGEHQHTPKGGRGSPFSHEDRPILGALTIEEIRKYSMSTSSRRSKSRSPDETPIIGTVGSYWSHTGWSMNSEMGAKKSGKDAKLKWSSPKLKTRLEPAFEASAAEV